MKNWRHPEDLKGFAATEEALREAGRYDPNTAAGPICTDPRLEAYKAALGDELIRFQISNDAFVNFMRQGIEEPSIADSDNWLLGTAASMAGMLVAADGMRELIPPPALTTVHQHVVDAANAVELTMQGMAIAFDEGNFALLVASASQISEFDRHLLFAWEALDRVESVCQ